MHDTWMERLSEYLDGEMDRAERDALEAHVKGCPECAAALADLRKVRAKARELNDAPVPPEIWSRIERAIEAPAAPRILELGRSERGRFAISLPELLAACLVVAIVSGGGVYAFLRHQSAAVTQPVRTASRPETQGTSAPAPQATVSEPAQEPAAIDAVPAAVTQTQQTVSGPMPETPQEEAITELRKALAAKRDRLDPATVRTLETNLAIIDLAIDQAKRALVADSANTYVKEHLAETMRRKVELLQRATLLASTSNPEGTR